jgi:UDP-N-acetylmuramoyl-tripeptide--D-alanyl-D-alanine ligase
MTISALYQIYLQCPVVTTDSRNCPEGSIFIALKGDNFNGNTFAKKALEDGCSYAVVDEVEYADPENNRIILVDDCLKTLQQLANYHRRKLGTKVIGITGTNGKTTTKELIAAVLSESNSVLYTQGNLNNHIGVPLTLLKLRGFHDLAVIEMGANHPGEIKILAEIAEPDYGIITNVGKAHLEGFGSFEGVIRTKGELYDY